MRKKGEKVKLREHRWSCKRRGCYLDEKGHTEFAKTSADHKREKEQLKVQHDREKG